jgi:hypothetical protein
MHKPDNNDPRILRTLNSIETPAGSIDLRTCPPSAEGRAALLWLVDACVANPAALAELRDLRDAEPRRYGWVCSSVELMVATLTDADPSNLYLSEYEVEPIALAFSTTRPAF